jgi:hypothetical protein
MTKTTQMPARFARWFKSRGHLGVLVIGWDATVKLAFA